MLTIKILGPGCSNCKKLEAIAKQGVELAGIQAEFIKVTDYAEITKYPVLSTPGLVINEKVVVSGRIPSPTEVKTWIANAQASTT
jgi:small redox-active disulfide protein 2